MEYQAFVDKFLSRLDRLDRGQIETFVGRLLREFQHLQRALDHLPDGIVLVDSKGRVEFLNAAAQQLLDIQDPRRGVEQPWRRVLRAEAYHNLRLFLEEHENTPEPVLNQRVPLFVNRQLFLEISLIPLWENRAKPTHTLWILRDAGVRDRKNEEDVRARYVEFLTTLTAGLAHEIRNPLNSLSIHSSLIEQGLHELPPNVPADDVERLQRSSQVLAEELQRLNRIVDQFLTAARPVKLDLQPTRIDAIFSQVVQLLEPQCRERGIELKVDSDPDLAPLPLDAAQLYQAVFNLAKNAMEAIGSDGRITLRSHLKSDHVLLEVSDTGPGIPESDRAKIFEPYYSTKKTGSGLGLMVVWRIVKAHGGAIAVDSRPGEGATFSIALPLDAKPVRLLPGRAVIPNQEDHDALNPDYEPKPTS